MQSTNSEYGSPYLAVCHVTFTLFSPEPKAEQLTLEFINTTVFRNLAQGSFNTSFSYSSLFTREAQKKKLQSYMAVYLASAFPKYILNGIITRSF